MRIYGSMRLSLGVFAVLLLLSGCADSSGSVTSANACHRALGEVVKANAASEKATGSFSTIASDVFSSPSGDYSTLVGPAQTAASRYRAEGKAYELLSLHAQSRYASAAATLSNSYQSVASATDSLATAAQKYASTKSAADFLVLKASVAAEGTALAANKTARTTAAQLPADDALVCK